MRIVVVGVTGSGKTTLARAAAAELGVPHVELDALHWEPKWTMAELDTFRARVEAALSGSAWVAEGNYGKVRDLIWPRAQQLVWLDYPLGLVMARLIRRTVRRVATREVLWGTNREKLRGQLLSRDSIFLWALQTHPRHRRDYPRLFAQPEHAHLEVIRRRSPRAAAMWLERLSGAALGDQL